MTTSFPTSPVHPMTKALWPSALKASATDMIKKRKRKRRGVVAVAVCEEYAVAKTWGFAVGKGGKGVGKEGGS